MRFIIFLSVYFSIFTSHLSMATGLASDSDDHFSSTLGVQVHLNLVTSFLTAGDRAHVAQLSGRFLGQIYPNLYGEGQAPITKISTNDKPPGMNLYDYLSRFLVKTRRSLIIQNSDVLSLEIKEAELDNALLTFLKRNFPCVTYLSFEDSHWVGSTSSGLLDMKELQDLSDFRSLEVLVLTGLHSRNKVIGRGPECLPKFTQPLLKLHTLTIAPSQKRVIVDVTQMVTSLNMLPALESLDLSGAQDESSY